MGKLMATSLALLSLSGCVLAPQTIELNENYQITAGTISPQRDALVRVVDQRLQQGKRIGHRGGRLPENSPLLVQQDLSDTLTRRLQGSLAQLGFGGSSPLQPIKVQLDINQFDFSCNEGVLVNQCGMEMELQLTVITEAEKFTKPFTVNESRRLAASPNAEYNQQWVNEVLDKLWNYMFSDAQLRSVLGVRQ
ncbi:hypothetical protein A3759_06725 [Thalassolituus sp. HI0120]|nr:hypothetical protein A3759_06725 [Thalassolituus sp. HI0120]